MRRARSCSFSSLAQFFFPQNIQVTGQWEKFDRIKLLRTVILRSTFKYFAIRLNEFICLDARKHKLWTWELNFNLSSSGAPSTLFSFADIKHPGNFSPFCMQILKNVKYQWKTQSFGQNVCIQKPWIWPSVYWPICNSFCPGCRSFWILDLYPPTSYRLEMWHLRYKDLTALRMVWLHQRHISLGIWLPGRHVRWHFWRPTYSCTYEMFPQTQCWN